MTIIYLLRNPEGEPFYVGKTIRPKERMREHKKRLGYRPIYDVLEDCGENWRECERKWIKHFKDAGVPLTNIAEGGAGGHYFPESVRRRISEAHKGRVNSPEHRAKISAATRGVPKEWTPEGLKGRKKGEFRPGESIHDRLSPEQYAKWRQSMSEVVSAIPSEERSRRNRKAWAAMTNAQRAERGRRISFGQKQGGVAEANRDPAKRAAGGQKSRDFWASITPERKREIAIKREAARQATLAKRRIQS